ncbi:MAG: chemotaxis protein CheX [Bryobacteraceae bacterium]|nr:chemotaxis protein CheX [Bryobacteraceae bacterium]
MKPMTNEELVKIMSDATLDVFSTMLGMKALPGPARHEKPSTESVDGVLVVVGIAGHWTGSGRIWCNPAFACRLSANLTATPAEAVDEEVLDAMGEIGNMIIGNIKTTIEEKVGRLGLSVPTVIYGRNFQTRSKVETEWIVVDFDSGADRFEVSFCLEPNHAPQSHNVHHPAAGAGRAIA